MRFFFLILILMQNCFNIYFNPVYLYIKRVSSLAFDNGSMPFYFSLLSASVMQVLNEFFNLKWFGVSNLLVLLVLLTILFDAVFGIKKSLSEARVARLKAESMEESSPEKRFFMRKYELKKFQPLKLQFTFFKALTLLAYLYMAKSILTLDDDDSTLAEILGFTTGLVLKVPLTIFWYYDFKSIGTNLEFILGKKLPIFSITEKIFEPKIKNFFNKSNHDL